MPFNRPSDSSGQENAVRKYYDDNTKLFLKHGEHGKTYGIHQPLYIKSTDSVETAMHTQHSMVLDKMRAQENPYHVLDLGCGVGSSLQYLARQSPRNIHFTGISISPGQIELAQQNLLSTPDHDRIDLICASFQKLPSQLKEIDLAYALESFIHSPDAEVFFQQISNCLNPGGLLLIFDDFLHRDARTKNEKRILREFRIGWKANNLLQVDHLIKLAKTAGLGLKEDIDLKSYLKLGRPRDKAIAVIAYLLRVIPIKHQYTSFLLGGNARQQGFKSGLLDYRMLVFEKLTAQAE